MGEGARALVYRALRARGVECVDARVDRLRDRFIDIYCQEPVGATRCFPFAIEILAGLGKQGFGIGICTNKAERPARLILEKLGLARYVGAIVGADSGYGQKPDPSPLLACASQLGVPSSNVIYIGDHHVDVETARAARVPVIAVAFGYSSTPTIDLGADRVVSCLSELPEAIRDFV